MAEQHYWTADEVETVRALWARGESLTRIGICLGKTRNAIGGMMNRRRDIFPKRGTTVSARGAYAPSSRQAKPAKKPDAVRRQPAPTRREKGPDPADIPADLHVIDAAAPAMPFAQQNAVAFIAVRDHQCKWPLWGKDEKSGAHSLCCGEPALVGSSWCAHHKARSIQTPKTLVRAA